MQTDIFAKRRKDRSDIFCLINCSDRRFGYHYPVRRVEGFHQYHKGLYLGVSNFYPDADSMKKLPDILLKLWDTVLMSIAATTVAAVFAILLALVGSRDNKDEQFI